MSAIANQNYGSIGRMFARQNVPAVYGAQKAASGLEAAETPERVDMVSLSAFAPRPLTATFLQTALGAAQAIGEEQDLTGEQQTRLREDRVFAAVSALALLGGGKGADVSWPGGIPAPTREELEEARRRLAQRPQAMQEVDNAETVARQRIELMEKVGRLDLGQVTAWSANRVAEPVSA